MDFPLRNKPHSLIVSLLLVVHRVCPAASIQKSCPPEHLHPNWHPTNYLPPPPPRNWASSIPPDVSQRLQELDKSMKEFPSKVISVVVLGGSVTAGALCKQGTRENKSCSWVARIESWLSAVYPRRRVSVVNLARGGTQTEVALASLSTIFTGMKHKVDLIFTDFSVNDVYEFDGNVGHHSAVQVQSQQDNYEKAFAVANSLITGLKALQPSAVHIMILGHCGACTQKNVVLNGMSDAAIYRGVMVIDTRFLHTDLTHFGSDKNRKHPDYPTHQLFADVVVQALRTGLRPDCPNNTNITKNDSPAQCTGNMLSTGIKDIICPTGKINRGETHYGRTEAECCFIPITKSTRPVLYAKLPSCLAPSSIYDAFTKATTIHGVVAVGWSVVEDRPGKPGWIATEKNATLTFEVTFGSVPQFTISYLRSYENIGKASLELNGHRIIIDGLWSKRISTTEVLTSQAYADILGDNAGGVDPNYAGDRNHFGIIGFGVLAHSTHKIIFTNLGQKFKLVSLRAC